MPQPEYAREKKRILPQDVQRAIWMAQNPSAVARVIEWADTDSVGLTLRITKRDAAWLIRRRDSTIRIGSCNDVGLPTARHIAKMTREAGKRGRDLKVFVDTLLQMQGQHYKDAWDWKVADEVADEKSEMGRRRILGEIYPTWTWRNMTGRFLEQKLPDLRESYRSEYAHYLNLPEFELINDRLVAEIKMNELELVRDRMLTAYAKSTTSRAVRQAREMLSWAWSYHGAKAGLIVPLGVV